MLNQTCISKRKSTKPRCMVFIMRSLVHFAKIIIEKICIYVHQEIGLQFSFSVVFLSGFSIKVILASQNEFASAFYHSVLWNNIGSIGLSSSLKVLQRDQRDDSVVRSTCSLEQDQIWIPSTHVTQITTFYSCTSKGSDTPSLTLGTAVTCIQTYRHTCT